MARNPETDHREWPGRNQDDRCVSVFSIAAARTARRYGAPCGIAQPGQVGRDDAASCRQPPICSSVERASARSRTCSGTRRWPQPASTLRLILPRYVRSRCRGQRRRHYRQRERAGRGPHRVAPGPGLPLAQSGARAAGAFAMCPCLLRMTTQSTRGSAWARASRRTWRCSGLFAPRSRRAGTPR